MNPVYYQPPQYTTQDVYSCPSENYTIYYVNNYPHVCYATQPDILYPMFTLPPETTVTQPAEEPVNCAACEREYNAAYAQRQKSTQTPKACCFGLF